MADALVEDLLQLLAAALDVVDGARSRQRIALG
jgi:hypothetical protein